MAHRKTMDPMLFETTHLSSNVSSPLRRKSLAAHKRLPSTPDVLTQHNDEAQIMNRRKQPANLDSLRNVETSERRVSVGLVNTLSMNEIMEHYSKCVKLGAENKITAKNVFALSMIDYMTVLNKQDRNSNNMQTAGTTLDISAKIYGLRVDCVHTDIFKMAGDSSKQSKKKEDEGNDSQDADNSGVTEDVETRRKKKRRSQKILCSIESLTSTTEVSNLYAPSNTNDSQTTDMLCQITYTVHAMSGYNLHLHEDVLLDSPPNNINEADKSDQEITIPTIEDFSQMNLCPMFADFHILGWSEADIPESPPRNQSPMDDNLRFDMDISINEPDGDQDCGLNYFDLNESSQEDVNRCMRVPESAEHIVDFSQAVAPKDKEKEKPLEYSYLQKGLKNLHWAGPTHWKPNLFPKAPKDGQEKRVGCAEGGKMKKNGELFGIAKESSEDLLDEIGRKISRGLKVATLKRCWEEIKLTLPEDVRYEDTNQTAYYNMPSVTVSLRPVNASQGNTADENGHNATVIEDDVNYNYENLNDTQNYCSRDSDGGDAEDENNENVFPTQNQDPDQNQHFDGDVATQAFTGENLVTVPKLTAQVQINYSTRAKKINMRQLKHSIWKSLVNQNFINNDENMHASNELDDQMKESRSFDFIYKKLPKLLGKNNAEALSPALAFVSLLHLANEKSLSIIPTPDMSNLFISQD